MEPIESKHVETSPGICGGKPRIAGHRIRVQDVVIWHEAFGLSPDEIVSEHPEITLSDVYAALAYYHDHRKEIRKDIEQEEDLARTVRSGQPSKLVEKLTRHNAAIDSIPPQ